MSADSLCAVNVKKTFHFWRSLDRPWRTSRFGSDHSGHSSFVCFLCVQVQSELDISQEESRNTHRGKNVLKYGFHMFNTIILQKVWVFVWKKVWFIGCDFIRRAYLTVISDHGFVNLLQAFQHLAAAVYQTWPSVCFDSLQLCLQIASLKHSFFRNSHAPTYSR